MYTHALMYTRHACVASRSSSNALRANALSSTPPSALSRTAPR